MQMDSIGKCLRSVSGRYTLRQKVVTKPVSASFVGGKPHPSQDGRVCSCKREVASRIRKVSE